MPRLTEAELESLVVALPGNTRLRTINLFNNEAVTDVVLARLQAALPRCDVCSVSLGNSWAPVSETAMLVHELCLVNALRMLAVNDAGSLSFSRPTTATHSTLRHTVRAHSYARMPANDAGLQRLQLSGHSIRASTLDELAEVLRGNTCLRRLSLHLADKQFGDVAVDQLVEAVKCCCVKELELWDTDVSKGKREQVKAACPTIQFTN